MIVVKYQKDVVTYVTVTDVTIRYHMSIIGGGGKHYSAFIWLIKLYKDLCFTCKWNIKYMLLNVFDGHCSLCGELIALA